MNMWYFLKDVRRMCVAKWGQRQLLGIILYIHIRNLYKYILAKAAKAKYLKRICVYLPADRHHIRIFIQGSVISTTREDNSDLMLKTHLLVQPCREEYLSIPTYRIFYHCLASYPSTIRLFLHLFLLCMCAARV